MGVQGKDMMPRRKTSWLSIRFYIVCMIFGSIATFTSGSRALIYFWGVAVVVGVVEIVKFLFSTKDDSGS
jgi:hypothetical protein